MYHGNHFVINALCAVCVGIQNKVPMEKIIEGIKNFSLTKNRMEIIERKDEVHIINDCYNANYDSVKAAIEYLGITKANRKIAILGEMGELEEYSKEFHEKIGEEIVKNKIDILITVGDLTKYMIEKAKELGMSKEKMFLCKTKDEAVEKATKLIEKEDYVLVKASLSRGFKEIVDKLI